MGTIRVAVVADCRLFYDGLCQILRADPSLLLVADTGAVTNDVNVDVRLVDAHVPSAVTLDPLKCDCVPTIVVNAPDADGWAADALNAGIRGLLSSGATTTDLLRAIHVVHDGGIWARRQWLIACVRRSADRRRVPRPHQGTPTLDARLSKREREVFRLAATGAGNKELAIRLAISEATVKAHMTRIFQKLGLNGRAELAAAYHGLTSDRHQVVRRLA